MEGLRCLLERMAECKEKRKRLALVPQEVESQIQEEQKALEARHRSAVRKLEKERSAALSAIDARAKTEAADISKEIDELRAYEEHWALEDWRSVFMRSGYVPNAERGAAIDKRVVNELFWKARKRGLIPAIKRLFRLGGFAPKAEMVRDCFEAIADGCANRMAKIDAIEKSAEAARNQQVTDTRRKIDEADAQFTAAKKELERKRLTEKEKALTALMEYDRSEEVEALREKLELENHMYEHLYSGNDAYSPFGLWGEYRAPTSMPGQILLFETKLSLVNQNGVETQYRYPVNIVPSSNPYVIAVTTDRLTASSTDGAEKLFVRKLLARMLKMIPPECCSYSVFDSLLNGASLERLIDVMNLGTTDFSFDLFTSEESDANTVSCAERRKYLKNRPAEIIKFIAGHSKSLFQYNKETGSTEIPFTWYIDFDFPGHPDTRLLGDLKELFVNAAAAGYSFIFVTNTSGLSELKALAGSCPGLDFYHIDADRSICEKDGFQVSFVNDSLPNAEQISNFMTALKTYYENGQRINNRIDHVFEQNGIDLRDASKKLSIPIALDSRGRLINLELGGEGSVHGFISGGTNCGKSTLLHTTILSACLHYHPKDLEIWIVDYKQTEFHLYKKRTPPHIKLIGVSKTADFTFSFLDRIEREASRRTALMNRFDVQNLADYRKHEGEEGYVNIPRLLIVIDEFHEMSQFVSPVIEYKEKLENILREYRAQGINCLLADQTFSTGLSGLTPAAMGQIGVRIAMRNEASPQEIKATLEVDRALYSDNMQRTIQILAQGEFIMKVYVRNSRGELTDIKLEKFKGLWAKEEDIGPIAKALRSKYNGQFTDEVLYVNTKERVPWDDAEPAALDRLEPIRYPYIRLYLGRSATLRPCFGLDLGRQPDENLSIVGGNAFQRWELLCSILQSCKYKSYKLIVFMAEFSDLMNDYGQEIRALCASIPNAELIETTEDWCARLSALEKVIDSRAGSEDTVCVFIGLEIANIELSRLPGKSESAAPSMNAMISRYADPGFGIVGAPAASANSTAFNALPIIDKLFSSGARNGIRCITEVSVFRQFSRILKIREMCRHKVAFSMSADDCLMYLGNSKFQASIGENAVYCDGGKEVRKLIPYLVQDNKQEV